MLTKCFLTEVDEDTDQENNFVNLCCCVVGHQLVTVQRCHCSKFPQTASLAIQDIIFYDETSPANFSHNI